MFSYQEFTFLFPLRALSVGVPVGLRHMADQVPLGPSGFWTGLEGFYYLLLFALFPVLLNQAPFSHPLRVVQHHWEEKGNERNEKYKRQLRCDFHG